MSPLSGTLGYSGALWGEVSEQQWKFEHFMGSVHTTRDGAYWRTAAFYSLSARP